MGEVLEDNGAVEKKTGWDCQKGGKHEDTGFYLGPFWLSSLEQGELFGDAQGSF